MTIATIKAAIMSALANKAELASIKKWFNSEPNPTHYPTSPFAWVEWAGGPVEPQAAQKMVTDDFYVVIVKKSADTDANEDALINFATYAEIALNADNTFGGTTFDSYVSNREVQKIPQHDYEIAAIRITVHTWRFE